MAQINFPTATSNGQTFEADNGVIYTYVGTPPNGFWSGSFQATGLSTLDARFLKLDSSNDPVTGGLNVTGGNVGIGTSSPAQLLDIASTAPNLRLTDTVDGHSEIDGNAANLKFNADKGNEKVDSNIVFSVDNSEKVRIISNGNVGIGTNSPAQKLEVAAVNPRIRLTDTDSPGSSATSYLEFYGNNARSSLIYSQSTGLTLQTDSGQSSGHIKFNTLGGNERMRVAANGNVGIGTDSPDTLLHLEKGDISAGWSDYEGDQLKIEGDIEGINIATSNTGYLTFSDGDSRGRGTVEYVHGTDSMQFKTAGSEQVRITSSGKVGIGTDAPDAKLVISEPVGSTTPAKMKFVNAGDRGVTVGFDNHNATPDFSISNGDQSIKFLSIDNTGKVGIGTTDINAKFTVSSGDVGFAPGVDADELFLENTDHCGITIGCGPNKKGNIYFGEQGVGVSRGAIVYNTDGDSLSFSTAGLVNEKMRITNAGLLGIGSTSPSSKLQIGSTSADSDNFITFGKRLAANESNLPVIGQTSTNGVNNDLGICATSGGGSIRFYTGNGSGGFGASSNDERFRIDSSGNAVFGDETVSINPVANNEKGVAVRTAGNFLTNTLSSNAPHQFRRNTDGDLIRFHNNATSDVGAISVGPMSTFYSTSSDYRLKENVVELDGAIDRVKQLEPKRFNFIVDPNNTVDGFLAHEAQTIVPEAVSGTHNEVDEEGDPVMQRIDQSKLVPLLTAALKEAIAKIETLEQRLADAGIE